MRIATWNLEWARPGSDRHRRCREHLESLDADVVVTTEDSLHEWSAFPHRIDGGPDWGYPVVEGRRKVIAWSRRPWTHVSVGSTRSTAGRLVVGSTGVAPAGGDRDGVGADGRGDVIPVAVRVVGVCIPWSASHVSTGRRDLRRWEDHLAFCEELGRTVATSSQSGAPIIVAGDVNQRIPRTRQPHHVADALTVALGGLAVPSAGEQATGRLIDHVAVGGGISATAVSTWPNEIDGRRLSDHGGVLVDVELAASD